MWIWFPNLVRKLSTLMRAKINKWNNWLVQLFLDRCDISSSWPVDYYEAEMEWFMGSKSILDLLVYPTKQTIKLFYYLTPQKSIIIESISTTKPFLKFTLHILTFFEGEFWKKKWHWWIIDCSNRNAHATEKNPLLSAFTHCINRQLPEKSTLWTTTCCIDQLSRESANGFLGFYHIFCQILA